MVPGVWRGRGLSDETQNSRPLLSATHWLVPILTKYPSYREKFEKIQKYFEPRFPEATKLGNEMIRTIEENLSSRKQDL